MKKQIVLIVSLALVIAVGIGATIAWLTDKTDTVVNTFTVGDVAIGLTETPNTDSDSDGKNDIWTAKMIPGTTLPKDPVVTVEAGSEVCWVFVKVEEKSGDVTVNYSDRESEECTFASFLDYEIVEGWVAGNGEGEGNNGVPEGVYFREHLISAEAGIDTEYPVLKENQVIVLDTITNEMMEALKAQDEENKNLSLEITAYAVQLYKSNTDKFTPAEAWEEVSKSNN